MAYKTFMEKRLTKEAFQLKLYTWVNPLNASVALIWKPVN